MLVLKKSSASTSNPSFWRKLLDVTEPFFIDAKPTHVTADAVKIPAGAVAGAGSCAGGAAACGGSCAGGAATSSQFKNSITMDSAHIMLSMCCGLALEQLETPVRKVISMFADNLDEKIKADMEILDDFVRKQYPETTNVLAVGYAIQEVISSKGDYDASEDFMKVIKLAAVAINEECELNTASMNAAVEGLLEILNNLK